MPRMYKNTSKTLVKDEAYYTKSIINSVHAQNQVFPECLFETIGDIFKMCSILKKTTAPFSLMKISEMKRGTGDSKARVSEFRVSHR